MPVRATTLTTRHHTTPFTDASYNNPMKPDFGSRVNAPQHSKKPMRGTRARAQGLPAPTAMPVETHGTPKQPLGMSPTRFMREHWQKAPLLVRGAYAHLCAQLQAEVSRDTMFARLLVQATRKEAPLTAMHAARLSAQQTAQQKARRTKRQTLAQRKAHGRSRTARFAGRARARCPHATGLC
jgi:hypothetical protein